MLHSKNQTNRAAKIAAALLCCVIFLHSTARAQVAYNFQTPDQITISSQPVDLTMDCLSANGYGQWTSEPGSLGSANLLSNRLTSTGLDNQQDGVLAYRPFGYNPVPIPADGYPTGDAIKCASNLQGNTRYVWLNTARTKFYVEGFDPGGSGIDISFSGLPSNDSIVNTPLLTAVEFPTSGTISIAGTSDEPKALDRFDIAIDASFLYIVWEQSTSSPFAIFAMVIDLSTGAMTMGPTQVTPVAGGGRRPTVAVDIRNSGTIAPFDVVCLSQDLGFTSANDSSNVWWTEFVPATTTFTIPKTANTSFGGSSTWDAPLHARMVVASEAGVPPSTTNQRAIYIIAQTNMVMSSTPGFQHLFIDYLFNGTAPFAASEYCDGPQNTTRATTPMSPINITGDPNVYDVIDNPIWAFNNPYDGANEASTMTEYTEFHCLYQLNWDPPAVPPNPAPTPHEPLMIIRDHDALTGFCVSGQNSAGVFFDDPVPSGINFDGYCGAVNQMGIHVHWISNGVTPTHFYRRDLRNIDQNIEENTLLTGVCKVSANATLTNNWLTLYSDPAGAPSYIGIGDFNIIDGADLAINASTGTGDFVEVGDSKFEFDGTAGDILEVDQDNQMDFYGGQFTIGTGEFKLIGTGEYMVSGSYGSWPYSISDPAVLNIHPGAVLDVGYTSLGASYFTCNDAKIHMNSGTNVITGLGTTHGKLQLNYHSSFTKCMLYSDDNSPTDNPTVLEIEAYGYDAADGGPSGNAYYNVPYASATYGIDTFEQCVFTGGEGDAPANLEITDASVAPNSVIVDNGWVSGWSFTGGNYIYWPISFTDVTFYEVIRKGIDINLSTKPPSADTHLYSLLIDGCGVQGFGGFTNFPNPDGFEVENAADALDDDGLRESITVTGNTFETGFDFSDGGVEAAIHFSDATGDIGYNSISGEHFQRGIWNESSTGGSNQATWTFICDNTISGLTHTGAAGLSTDNYTGYAKLNNISGCAIGQISDIGDKGHIIASSYTDNAGPGYQGSSTSETDLSGVHHNALLAEPDDNAGNDTLTGNNPVSGVPGVQIQLDGILGARVFLGLESLSGSTIVTPSWTVFGENDIEGSPNQICSASSIGLGDVSNNYWGGGSFSFCTGTTGTGASLGTQPSSSGWSCSSGLIAYKEKNIPLSILSDDSTPDDCALLYAWGSLLCTEGPSAEPMAYDTLRMFLEQCPFYGDSGGGFNPNNSWNAFVDINAAASAWTAGGYGRWADYLAFLKQVLWLNPDSNWYCSDVADMMEALQWDEPAKEAALEYVLDNNKCPGFTQDFETYDTGDSKARHQLWLDTVVSIYDTVFPWGSYPWWLDSMVNMDTLAHPYDSTIPSLQQVGLQILMGQQYAGVSAPSPITSTALLSAQLMENPTETDEIGVSFQMGRTALVTMQLRDILGRLIPISNAQYLLQPPGTHEATLPVPNLPPGTYYLRLSTDAGDAITLKVVKQ